ncbi:hypothetical protein E2542_SST21905 [Spatholobus suberectus]|nr:hypothetical protein E2542_SST21905 [Spatholobus suberectus]
MFGVKCRRRVGVWSSKDRMVGGVSVAVESHSWPYLCVDALATSTSVSVLCKSLRMRRGLSSSFVDSVNTSFKKQRKHKERTRRSVTLSTSSVANMRTLFMMLKRFVATNQPADRKRFIRSLGKEQRELAERVMITRLDLYGKWIKKCNHAEIYQEISDENLELMRERLMETVIWPSDDTNTEKIGR